LLQKDCQTKPPVHFLGQPLKLVQSLALLSRAICRDLSWAYHDVKKLAFKASSILGILHRSKSFLGKTELLTVDKAFLHSLMDYCSSRWSGTPASHPSLLDSAESKALKIIGIYCDEAKAQGLLISHCRQVIGLHVFYRLFADIAPSPLSHSSNTHNLFQDALALPVTSSWLGFQNSGCQNPTFQRLFCLTLATRTSTSSAPPSLVIPNLILTDDIYYPH